MLTEQETFDLVCRHLFTQRERCVDQGDKSDFGPQCRYRHNGLKCAIGAIIPDDQYSPLLEGRSAIHADVLLVLRCHTMARLSLLESLQAAHDTSLSWIDPDRMDAELRYIAEVYGLSTDVLTAELVGVEW